MTRHIFISMRSITAIVLCVVLFTGCSSLLIHDDDNIAVVATKVTVRTVNCALTITFGCMSEWLFMHEAYKASLVWYGNGDINGDNYKCQQEASSGPSGASGYIHMPVGNTVMSVPMDSGGGRQINQQLYYSCMQARGYTLMEKHEYDKWRREQANDRYENARRRFDELREANKGSHCAASNATLGTQVRTPEGKLVKITALYGPSPRCSNPETPNLVDAE